MNSTELMKHVIRPKTGQTCLIISPFSVDPGDIVMDTPRYGGAVGYVGLAPTKTSGMIPRHAWAEHPRCGTSAILPAFALRPRRD